VPYQGVGESIFSQISFENGHSYNAAYFLKRNICRYSPLRFVVSWNDGLYGVVCHNHYRHSYYLTTHDKNIVFGNRLDERG